MALPLSRLSGMMAQHALSFPRNRLGCHSRGIGNPIYALNMWSRRMGSRFHGNDRLKRSGCHSRGIGNPIYALNMWSRRMGSRSPIRTLGDKLLGNDRLKRSGCHSRGIGNPIYALNMWSRRMGSRFHGNDRLFGFPLEPALECFNRGRERHTFCAVIVRTFPLKVVPLVSDCTATPIQDGNPLTTRTPCRCPASP